MRLVILAMLVLVVSRPAGADILLIETNTWANRRPLTWSGVLRAIEPQTQLARFEFFNGRERETVAVHLTRLRSLEFGRHDAPARSFPPTRADIASEAGGTSAGMRNVVVLNDADVVALDLPEEVHRSPAGQNRLKVAGDIVEADRERVVIEARTSSGGRTRFALPRGDVYQWLRGR